MFVAQCSLVSRSWKCHRYDYDFIRRTGPTRWPFWSRQQTVENSLWKRLRTCRKTACRMNELKGATPRCTAVRVFQALSDQPVHSKQHSLRASVARARVLWFSEGSISGCAPAEPARPSRKCRLDRR
jgi:hypothetical protein